MSPAVLPTDIKRGLLIRQIAFLFAIALSVALGVYVVLWSQTPNHSLLYGDLSARDMSQVLDTLKKLDISYKVDEFSGAVMVPSAKVYQARMQLAAEGLPRGSNNGFAILQEEQHLGTSQFMEKARYQHALEHEIALSISQLSPVRSARVHLALPKQSTFVRQREAPSASILLDLYPGHQLQDEQIAAIANLVAASVPGLSIGDVSIIDQYGRLMTHDRSSGELALTASQFQYTRKVEASYVKRIEDILIPIVGAGSVKAQVAAELDFTTTEQAREAYNPDMPAVRSEYMEEGVGDGDVAAGIPGAPSNQPDTVDEASKQVAQGTTNGATANMQRKTTRNYELDKTVSYTRMPVGRIRRLSAAVVVDYKMITDARGEMARTAHSPEELQRFESLIKEAIGFNLVRGDSVNVMNAEFSRPDALKPLPQKPIWRQAWLWDILKQVFGALFVFFLVFGVLRPAIKSMLKKEITLHETLLASPDVAANAHGRQQGDGVTDTAGRQLDATSSDAYESNIMAARNIMTEDPKRAAQVIKGWIEE